ncbi:MAG: LPS export ABC transporter periplasmic protein LptC [Dysgonamonadaceae bacterium]|jgi:LPS export ABC transporter protein LptC|nr:LPS export ABC transporter periplasmic protein LptC [Dysgonamonadaceae bacterium]
MVLQTKTSVIGILLTCMLMLSCNQRNTGMATVEVNASEQPLLHGEGISWLISDSGVTRFRLKTKVLDSYSNDTASYWYFPQGIRVDQFDSLFQVSGYVEADTAYYFDKTGLWQLIHNVLIKNTEGTTCETSELFWNSKEPPASMHSIYSDKFVKITKPDQIITTIGFKSNQSLTRYILYKNTLETEIDKNNSPEE